MRDLNEKEMARWEKARAKGKAAYIIRTSVIFFVLYNIGTLVFSWFSGYSDLSTSFLVSSVVMSPFIGFTSWWGSEGRYQNTMLNQKIRKD